MPPELTDLEAIDTELAERHLADFIDQAWHCIETRDYQRNWHIDAISEHLEAVSRGELQGILLITVPFRCMKSRTVNVFWPAWMWAQNPDPFDEEHGYPVQPETWMGPGVKLLSLSHGRDVAVRDAVATRRLLDSRWYQERWGDRVQFTSDQNQKQRYENTNGGVRLSTSQGGILGEGGDIIIGDDLISREDAHSDTVRTETNTFLDETLSTRVNDPERTVFVIIMQRLHENDPAGHLLANEPDLTHLMLPMEFEPERRCYSPIKTSLSGKAVKARYLRSKQEWIPKGKKPKKKEDEIEWRQAKLETVYPLDPRKKDGELFWPERFTRPRVDKFKQTLGTYGAAGQLQQRPSPREGGMFQRQDFDIIDRAPEGCQWIRGWDFAGTKGGKGPFSAGVKMGLTPDKHIIISSVARGRWSTKELYDELVWCAENDGCPQDFPQDPAQAGKAQVSHIATLLHGHEFFHSTEDGNKEGRAQPLSAQCESGNLHLVRGVWNEPFIDEAILFPNGKFSDQVDASSRAYARLLKMPEPEDLAGPIAIQRTI